MGLDLRLLPFDAEGSIKFAHTVLDVWRRSELWDAIDALPQRAAPEDFSSFVATAADGDLRYGVMDVDAYGEPLMTTTAGDLSTLWLHPGVRDNNKNRAIWDYLAALPPETRVALDWH